LSKREKKKTDEKKEKVKKENDPNLASTARSSLADYAVLVLKYWSMFAFTSLLKSYSRLYTIAYTTLGVLPT